MALLLCRTYLHHSSPYADCSLLSGNIFCRPTLPLPSFPAFDPSGRRSPFPSPLSTASNFTSTPFAATSFGRSHRYPSLSDPFAVASVLVDKEAVSRVLPGVFSRLGSQAQIFGGTRAELEGVCIEFSTGLPLQAQLSEVQV